MNISPAIKSMGSGSASDEISHDFPPFFRVYKDGRIERYSNCVYVPPSENPDTGVRSKDVKNNTISARIYLPKITEHNQKFPLLIYIHGGGFSMGSAFSEFDDKHQHSIVAKVNMVTISVDYRLAPENPLTVCYDDSWAVMKWAALHTNDICTDDFIKEPWLNDHVDFSRVFLAGDSAGANIVHDMMVRASASEKPLGDNFKIVGMALIHPFFGNNEPADEYFQYIFPTCPGLDDPRVNPAVHPRLLSSLVCQRIMIFTAENDRFKDRGLTYYEAVKKSEWKGEVEIMESQGEEHVFHLFKPTCEKAVELMKKLVDFFNKPF